MKTHPDHLRLLMLVPLLIVIATIRLDPYSSGGKGGVSFETVGWQIGVGVALVGLTVAAAIALIRGNLRIALALASVEAGIAGLANLVFFLRDGAERLAPVTHRAAPAVVLTLGAVARIAFIAYCVAERQRERT